MKNPSSSSARRLVFAFCLLLPAFAAGGELGALARVFSWPDGVNNFSNYTKVAGGAATQSAAGNGWKSYGTASLHSLAVGGSATGPNTGRFQNGYVGGSAYWFEQITISSPSVPVGTQGRAEFTLYFDGQLSTGSLPTYGREYNASIGYRWAAHVDGADNVADPNVGESYGETITVFPGAYMETTGGNFRNQARNHSVIFRFGQPFDFTVALHASGYVPFDTASNVRMELRCKGWNGFQNIHLPIDVHAPGGIPVTDATVSSQSGFNYTQPSSTTYSQWARLYQLDAASMEADSNGNGLSNFMEYALGRDPLGPDSGAPVRPSVMEVEGQRFPCFSFNRPRLGGKPGDVVYLPKHSTTLANWSDSGLVTTVEPNSDETETVTVRSATPAGQGAGFFRLEVEPAQP
ncbi:hypothetical protein [Luteolibacter soli]|uniref:Uncharacterized protein n=1 Tax=Luteolibacter soli TaxID=3135280 RepID=A0ABU9AT85_9BACT